MRKNVNWMENNLKQSVLRILLIVFLLLATVFLLFEGMWSSTRNLQYVGNSRYAEPSWIYQEENTVLESGLTVPAFRHMKKGVSYSIKTKLTYNGKSDHDPSCFFFVDHMFTRVYLEDELLFSYMPEDVNKKDLSKSPGNVYTVVHLPKDCYAKELKIEFIPALDADIDYQLPNPTFGDYSTQMSEVFWEELPHNIMAVLALFLGISCIFYSTLALADPNYREGIYIGVFAILFGLYNITESDFDFYMISNPYYTYVLDYITFTLIPIFLLAFLRDRMDVKQRKISLVLIFVSVGMFFTELLLHFTGIMDMREFLPILHVVYFIDFLVHLLLIAISKKKHRKRELLMQMFPILFGMIIDVMVYYMHWQLGSSDSTFTAIGVIIFLFSELVYVWKYSMEIYTESTRSRVYQQMASVDSLTGIGNRRAFELEKDALINGEKSAEALTVVSADLNNLKITNDRLGHASGDFLIRSAANVLTDLSVNFGNVYRVGGDEFIAFLYGMSNEELKTRVLRMYRQIEDINKNSNAKLDLAIGVQENDGNVEEALQIADHNMYEDKQLAKNKNQ